MRLSRTWNTGYYVAYTKKVLETDKKEKIILKRKNKKSSQLRGNEKGQKEIRSILDRVAQKIPLQQTSLYLRI